MLSGIDISLIIDQILIFNIKYAMTKEELIETIQRLLKTDTNMAFLLQLKKTEIETLLACIRSEVGR